MMSKQRIISLVKGGRFLTAITLLFGFGIMNTTRQVLAQNETGYILDIREIETTDLGVPAPAGLAFSPSASLLLVTDQQEKGERIPKITMIDLVEQFGGTARVLGSSVDLPVNFAFNGAYNSLFLLNRSAQELDQVRLGPDGRPAPITRVCASYNIRAYGAQTAEGMAFDPQDGRLFLLDPAGKRMIIITPDANGSYEGNRAAREGQIDRVGLDHLKAKALRGIAYNPMDSHLYLIDVDGQKLFEIDDAGRLFSTRDLSPFSLRDPQGMVFAPSGDLTDDPVNLNLYIADSGLGNDLDPRPGEMIEFSLTPPIIQ